jgi:hypothetical protein
MREHTVRMSNNVPRERDESTQEGPFIQLLFQLHFSCLRGHYFTSSTVCILCPRDD